MRVARRDLILQWPMARRFSLGCNRGTRSRRAHRYYGCGAGNGRSVLRFWRAGRRQRRTLTEVRKSVWPGLHSTTRIYVQVLESKSLIWPVAGFETAFQAGFIWKMGGVGVGYANGVGLMSQAFVIP